jgi:hypothetical protein
MALLPLAVLVFWIGLYPQFFLDRMAPALEYSTMGANRVARSNIVPEAIARQLPAKEDLHRAY